MAVDILWYYINDTSPWDAKTNCWHIHVYMTFQVSKSNPHKTLKNNYPILFPRNLAELLLLAAWKTRALLGTAAGHFLLAVYQITLSSRWGLALCALRSCSFFLASDKASSSSKFASPRMMGTFFPTNSPWGSLQADQVSQSHFRHSTHAMVEFSRRKKM